jgi:biopolymer transport protein TolR
VRGVRKPVVVKPASDVKSEINVTPLVDVVLVLLIIFMVIMPMLQKELAVRVPETETANEPDEAPPDQLVVRIERSGERTINGEPASAESYERTLQEQLNARGPTGRTVFVSAHDEAPYKVLVDTFAAARRAGAQTLAMLAEQPEVAEAPQPAP